MKTGTDAQKDNLANFVYGKPVLYDCTQPGWRVTEKRLAVLKIWTDWNVGYSLSHITYEQNLTFDILNKIHSQPMEQYI